MKSKQEIEQLANEYANGKSSSDVFKDAHKNDFIKGYTQCQEDMAKELEKETLDELFDAHEPEDFIDENKQNWWEKNKQD